MALVLFIGTWILPARARAESSLSPSQAAGLSVGVTVAGLGLAAGVVFGGKQLGYGLLIGGGTLVLAPSVGRLLLDGGHGEQWVLSRAVIAAIGTGITFYAAAHREGAGGTGTFVVGSFVTSTALFFDGVADIVGTAQICQPRVAVAPTMLGRAPGLVLGGTF